MSAQSSDALRVLVWGENRHEQIEPHVAAIYPEGMHTTIAAGISREPGRAGPGRAPRPSTSPSTV